MLQAVVAPLPWGVDHRLHVGLAEAFPPGMACALPDAGGGLEAAVLAVEEAREARGWPRAVVVGHSMAGLVALAHALRHPGRVAALVLVGAAAGPGFLREGLWRAGHARHAAWRAAREALRAGGPMEAYVDRLLELSLRRPEAMPRLRADLAGARLDPARMDAFFRDELPRLDLAPRLRELAAPALVLVGREDPLCTPAQSEALARSLPRARLEVLEDCGHFPWHEQPAAFRAALARFLGTLPPAQG